MTSMSTTSKKTVNASSSTRSVTRGAKSAPKIKGALATKTQSNDAPAEKNTPVAMLQYHCQDEEAAEEDEEREDCPCFSCQEVLGTEDEAVQCDSCDNWYCVACSELNKAAYNSITDHGGVVMWFCKHCNIALPGMKKLLKTMTRMGGRQNAMEAKQKKLEDSHREVVARVERLEVSNNNARGDGEGMNELIAKCVREEVYEAKQRDMRRNNVIVRNLPEPVEDKTDEDSIKLLTDELGITQKVNITEAKRLGKEGKKDGDDRPRLLKLECESLEQMQLFLNNSRKLMNSRSMKDVYIGKDWTKKQQGEQRMLRVALQARREESGRNQDGKTWRIKGSKIIEAGQDTDVHLVPGVAGGAAAKN